MKRDIVLLSTADWDNPFWTNKQHVAVELAKDGHRVLYIDSLGLRRPSASARDVRRIVRRLKKAFRPPVEVRKRLYVWSPVTIPLQRWGGVRALNRRLLSRALRAMTGRLGMSYDLLWTYNPLTTRLLDVGAFRQVVYHCVDEIKAQPGMPAAVLEAGEEELCRAADLVFTTSRHLTETRRRWNPETHYFPNVADFDHFHRACDPSTPVPADLAAIPAPRIGFIGAVSGYKVDFRLLRTVAEARPRWSLVLIGAVGEGDPWTDPTLLEGVPNIHLLGPRDYRDLPGYLKGMDVAILPNTINEYTRSMFPMKFFEYLAAGRPVVAVALDALAEFAHVATLADSPEVFIDGIERALAGEAPPLEARLAVARQHTYAARNRQMMELVEAALKKRNKPSMTGKEDGT